MSRYESRQDVADKAEYEGGLLDFMFGYGCRPDEMPDAELAEAIRQCLDVAGPLIDRVDALLPAPGYE